MRDPYALNGERNRRSIVRFLAEFARIMGDWPPVIEILFMDPEDLQQSDSLSAWQQDAALRRELQGHGKPAGTDVCARPIGAPEDRDFHDREVAVEVSERTARARSTATPSRVASIASWMPGSSAP